MSKQPERTVYVSLDNDGDAPFASEYLSEILDSILTDEGEVCQDSAEQIIEVKMRGSTIEAVKLLNACDYGAEHAQSIRDELAMERGLRSLEMTGRV